MQNTRFIKLKTELKIISSELLNFTEHTRDIMKIKFSSFHKTMCFLYYYILLHLKYNLFTGLRLYGNLGDGLLPALQKQLLLL